MDMKKSLLFNSVVCTSLFLMILLTNNLIAQVNIPDITGTKDVEFDLACKITLIQGDKATLTITGDNDELEYVHVRMSGDRLRVYNDKHNQHKEDVLITITLPNLNELSIGGAADITTPKQVSFDNLEIEITGVADLDLKLKSKKLDLQASGVITGGIIGETADLKIDISGVGKLDASEFKSQNCEVEVSGVAKASVYAVERLDASVSGVGRISYQGRPIINRSSSGLGWISRL
jgi:hypothetical protein